MRVVARTFDEIPAALYREMTGDAFFVSRGFAELWRARSGEPRVWCVEDGGMTLALIPGVEFRRGPATRFASMPDGCYGGVFTAPAAASRHVACVRALLDALAARYTIVDVFDFGRSIATAPGYTTRNCETRLVTLTGPAWIPADPTIVQQAQRAEREGIQIEVFDVAHHLDGVMQLAETTARVHRCRQRYPRAFHEGLAALARTDDRIVWRYCARDGVPVCSQLYVIERGMLQAWQSYFDRTYSFLRPNPAVRLEVCRAFAADGGRILNLGSTPSGARGLAAYKSRWGGRVVAYPGHGRGPLAGLRNVLGGSRHTPARDSVLNPLTGGA